ncbi:MAG: N-6 DNA methylase, partial [Candidatus Marinimicrobia bacterium]|nr:N-6 DNA methylase [Candidatus Neomarinimicrobiota bacterium]
MNYEEGKRLLEQKVEDFSSNKDEYLSHTFHEASARARFIDPFFIALGWDFEQTNLKINQWDVLREYSDHSTTKRPDYAFRINGELKFFVEAKAPHVHLTNKEPVFQAKRYAFSTNGKAPIVILTDFEEFRVFNALKKPDINLPLEGVLKQYDLTYEKYLAKWDLLYGHFSKEAVADGSLEELKGKLTKKTKTLDREFLEEITHWREMLARNIALRNLDLTVEELNVSVQRILDRLIFIRNLEDRHIEPEGKLLSIALKKPFKGSVYSNLVPLFRKLDRDYNGLLFKKHFSEELVLDDKILIYIIKHLSWPLSPYQFDVIEPEILGRIYEKFLGSKIRLTAGHHAKVEEKPEVRKAGGIYYTPQYIVDYIVKHTVGEKVKGKTPEEITEIKIVDPACGSGSFLLGAFEYLMNYHVDWYGKNRKKRRYKDDWYETADGDIRLSVRKKSNILQNNIFGVDIDREATEVSIMSLYLKLLDEGFDKGQAMLFMKGHILPDMSSNIKCGNSLISRFKLDADIKAALKKSKWSID